MGWLIRGFEGLKRGFRGWGGPAEVILGLDREERLEDEVRDQFKILEKLLSLVIHSV